MNTILTNKSGNAVIYSMIIATIMMTVTLSLTNAILNSFRTTANVSLANMSFFAAEAGIEKGIYDIAGHGPGYQPETFDLNIETDADVEIELDNRIYDYTQIAMEGGDSIVYPLFYDNGRDLEKVAQGAVNMDIVYVEQDQDTINCPESGDEVTPENQPGDYRITWLYEAPGLVEADDLDFEESLNITVDLDQTYIEDYFCWIPLDDGPDGFYLKIDDGGDILWINLAYPGDTYDADDADPDDVPGSCEYTRNTDSGTRDLELLLARSDPSILLESSHSDYEYFYYFDDNENRLLDIDDYRITPFFADGTEEQDIEYDAVDLDLPIADISYKLKASGPVDQEYVPGVGNEIYGLVDDKYYLIYPNINFSEEAEGATYEAAGFISNIKSDTVNFSRGFTFYIDADNNNIANPNVVSRWSVTYKEQGDDETDYTAVRNLTTNFADINQYWSLNHDSCEPETSPHTYLIDSSSAGLEYSTSNSAESGKSLSEFLNSITYQTEDLFLIINTYQDVIFVMDPDPDTDEEPYDENLFLPSPYLYLRSTGTAGDTNSFYTEQLLETRLEQSGTIPIFNQTVVF